MNNYNTLDLSPLSQVTLGSNYLEVPANADQDELKAIFHTVANIEKANAFFIGDVLCAIELKHGEQYAAALSSTQYNAGSLRNMKLVCARIPKEKRAKVSFKHHLTALSLCKKGNEAKAIDYLQLAERENLSNAKMQTLIRTEMAPREKITINIPDKEYFNALSSIDTLRLYLEKKPTLPDLMKRNLAGGLAQLIALTEALQTTECKSSAA